MSKITNRENPIARTSGRRRGQALLLVVVMMGGVLFLVTAVAGLLMFYQIQQGNDTANSTVSIFAADAGIERALYHYFYGFNPSECVSYPCMITVPPPTLLNGATTAVTILVPDPDNIDTPVRIYGSGSDPGARTVRTLEMSLTQGSR